MNEVTKTNIRSVYFLALQAKSKCGYDKESYFQGQIDLAKILYWSIFNQQIDEPQSGDN